VQLPYYHILGRQLRSCRIQPTKIIGIGRNYRAHADEMGEDIPAEPLMFLKAPSALLRPGEAIVRPRGFHRVDFEGELAVVIGNRAYRVSADNALGHVMGFTCANDVTVRDLQQRDNQWTRAKGMDTFCPIGPCVVDGLDSADLPITTRVNGDICQDSHTGLMVFPVPELIAYASYYMTLEPGDIILTGTPAGVGNLQPGDVVEIAIQGIGVLSNPVVDE